MQNPIPADLLSALRQQDLLQEEILCYTQCDIDLHCEFGDTYLLLTRDSLFVAAAAPVPTDPKVFSAYGKKGEFLPSPRAWDLSALDLESVTRLEVEYRVVGGAVVGEVQGQPVHLAAFSGQFVGDARRFCSAFDKLKAGEPLTQRDLQDTEPEAYCPKCGTAYPDPRRKICPKCMDRKGIFFRILGYFKPFIPQIVLMLFCYFLSSLLGLAWPYLNGKVLYDQVLGGSATTDSLGWFRSGLAGLAAIVVTMLFTKLLGFLVEVVHSIASAHIVPDVVKNIRGDVFGAMGRLSISFYASRQTGSLMTRVLDDSNRVLNFFIDQLPFVFTNTFTLISTVVIMMTMNWRLGIVSLILLPLLPYLSVRMLPRLWHLFGKRHRATRSLNSQLHDNITGARVVKAFGQEDREIQRFAKYNTRVRTAELNIVKFDNKFNALYAAVQNLALFAVWGFGSWLVLRGQGIELGVLITFASYVSQLSGPLNFLSQVFRQWTDTTNAAQRIFEILDAIPEVTEPEQPVHLQVFRGEIELRHVTFGYEPHHEVLRDINLHVAPGEYLGIVGRSGAGKSTLVNLINRLYDPKEGEIFMDGVNIRDLAFSEFRGNIAMVSQETYIFMGTVEQNIAYAKENATHEEVVAAAIAASAHDFICRMPDGYDTVIGSSGQALSGGERQRISIARAILANPRILILDEATASVDTETELAIQDALDRLTKGRTTLSIAHRLSTLRNADRLVVLDDGRITEEGTHLELIHQKGTYYKLMQLQSKALAMRGLE